MFARIRHVLSSSTTSLLILALMAFLPFVVPYHAWAPSQALFIPQFYREWLTLLLGFLALYPLFNKSHWQHFAIPQVSLMFLGFALIVMVQSMLGLLHSIQYALLVLAYVMAAFLMAVLGGHLRRELGWEKLATTLAWSILVGGLLNAVYVFLQYFSSLVINLPFITSTSNLGLIANINHLANYVALAIASLLYLYAKSHLKLNVFLFCLVLLLSVLSLTAVTSTWWYLAGLTLLAIVMQINAIRQRTGSTNIRSLVRVALLVLPMFVIVQWMLSWLASDSPVMAALNATPASDWSVRLHIWHESLLLFLRSPWLGVGFGQTHWMSLMTLDAKWSVNLPGAYQHTRNIVLQVLAEMGVAGFVVLLAGAFAWLRVFQWKKMDLEAWWLLAVLSMVGINSLFEANLNDAYFLTLTAFLLGAGDEKSKHIHLVPKGIVIGKTMLIGVLGLMMFALVNTLIANTKLENAVLSHHPATASDYHQADINQGLAWVKAHSLLAPYADLAYAKSLGFDQANIEDKLMINGSALRLMPTQQAAYRHVLFLEFNGQHEEAVAYMQRGVQAYPHAFKTELQTMPLQYWDMYLRTFSEAITPKTPQRKPAKN
jgi:O-antigen ligase